MTFTNEADFENALIEILSHKGWEREVINYPTEKNLLKNWATILFDNNRDIDRLGDYPLTEGEMQQIMEQIAAPAYAPQTQWLHQRENRLDHPRQPGRLPPFRQGSKP